MSLYDQFQKEQTRTGTTSSLYSKFLDERTPKPNQAVEYAKESVGTFNNVVNFVKDPIGSTYRGIHENFLDPAYAAGQKVGESLKKFFNPNSSGVERVAAGADIVTSGLSIPLTSISGLFGLAEKTPVLKNAADIVNLPFMAIDKGSRYVIGGAIDNIPDSVLSPESKKIVKQPIEDLTSLVSQIYLGGKIMRAIENQIAKGKKVTPDVAQKAVADAKTGAVGFDSKNPIDTVPEIIRSHVTKMDNFLKDPDMAALAKEQLPQMMQGMKVDIVDGLKAGKFNKAADIVSKVDVSKLTTPDQFISQVQPLLKETGISIPIIPKETLRIEVPKVAEVLKATPKESIFDKFKKETASEVPEGVSQTSFKIQQEAARRGIEVNDLAKIERMKMETEAAMARDFIARDLEGAKKIVETGDRPAGTPRVESVFNELKAKALAESDVQLISDLAKSKIGTEAGQSLKALDDGIRLDADPVQAIKDLRTAKEEVTLKNLGPGKTIEKVVKEEKSSVPKIEKVKKQTWEDFINELEC